MRPESKKFLFDIQQACEKLSRFTQGCELDDYVVDELLQSAVERQLFIIGEAISQLAKIDPDTASIIPDYRRIIAFRNILAHGYAAIEHKTVWGVLRSDLDALATTVSAMLAK